jgi:hypothetical protein
MSIAPRPVIIAYIAFADILGMLRPVVDYEIMVSEHLEANPKRKRLVIQRDTKATPAFKNAQHLTKNLNDLPVSDVHQKRVAERKEIIAQHRYKARFG